MDDAALIGYVGAVFPFLVAVITVLSIFGGACLGFVLQKYVPDAHLKAESKDSMKLAAGLIATMAALVLGLLVGSAKSSFDTVNAGIVQGGAKMVLLDHTLARYGPATQPIRAEVRQSLQALQRLLWPPRGDVEPNAVRALAYSQKLDEVADLIRALKPQDDVQRQLQTQALQFCNDVQLTRWTLIEQEQSSLPTPFLIVLLFWLTMLNLIYGLFAPRNHTIFILLFICALSVAGAIFLIFEMDRPLEGMIKASEGPVVNALEHLGE